MSKKWRLKRIGIVSAVKIGGTVSGVTGLIIGTIIGIKVAIFSAVIGYFFSLKTAGFGFAALVLSPFFFTVLYFLSGIIFSFLFALLYNLTAGIVGGIQIEIDEEKKYEYKIRM